MGSTNNNNLKNNVGSSISKLKNVMNFGAIYIGAKKAWNVVKDISTEYTNMIETNNLFEVSMGRVVDEYGNLDTEASKYYTKAMAFQNEMNEKLLTNKAELKEYQAMYYSMLKSQGIDLDSSYLMSESLTKAGYDIASLYNLTVDDAMNKLKSGLAGQVEPLRAIGIDISESSLQKVLNDVGIIDRSVQQLSYAEKEVARYIAILQQGRQAQGDFAKTMDSSANQIKIFQNQIAELKQVAGSFIMNTFGGVLVYVNAIIMVVKEILKAFANLFGYDLDSGGTGLNDNISDVNDNLGSAVNNAKELKKQLMGFDEINNITLASTSSSNSGITTGIDSKLLEALDEWDNKMDSISGKAQEIRDRMLEWLGFVRNDDGTWRLGEGYTNFEKILDIVKTIGLAIGTWKIAKTVTDFLNNFKIINKTQSFGIAFGITLSLTGIYLLYKGISHLLNGDADLFTIFETIAGGASTTFGLANIIKTIAGKMGNTTMTLGNSLKIGFGVTLSIASLMFASDSISKLSKGNFNASTIIESILSTIGFTSGLKIAGVASTVTIPLTIALSVVQIFAAIDSKAGIDKNQWEGMYEKYGFKYDNEGGLIANVVLRYGLVAEEAANSTGWDWLNSVSDFFINLSGIEDKATDNLNEYKDSLDKLKSSYKETISSINSATNATIAEIEGTKSLVTILGGLVDSNGKVTGSYDKVDSILKELNDTLGTEITRKGNVIAINGEVAGSYQSIKDNIYEIIEAKKKEAEAEAMLEIYKESYKQKAELYQELSNKQTEYAQKVTELSQAEKNGIDTNNEYYTNLREEISNLSGEIEIASTAYQDSIEESSYWSIMAYKVLTDEMIKSGDVTSTTLQNLAKTQQEVWEETYNNSTNNIKNTMLSMSTTLDTWSPQLEEKWKNLAQKSETEFKTSLKNVDDDTKAVILASVSTTSQNANMFINEWINLANNSERAFLEGLDNIDTNVAGEILSTITKINGYNAATTKAWANLANKDSEAFINGMSGLDDEVSRELINIANTVDNGFDVNNFRNAGMNVSNGLSEGMNNNLWIATNGARNLVNETNSILNNGLDGYESGQDYVKGVDRGIKLEKWSLWDTVKNLAGDVMGWFKNRLGIHSPSREMAKIAQYIPLGIAKGIEDNSNAVFDSMEELSEGIKVNAKDFAVDTNQFVDYGEVSGQVQAQANVTMSNNIAGNIAQAVKEAMRETEVNVNIEAKTEKGIIFKTVRKEAEEFYTQTGKAPFPVF